MNFYTQNNKVFENARFVLEVIAEAKPGNNIVILADRESYENARALADCAKALSMNVFIADVDMYGGEEGYDNLPIMEPLRQAILHADITFMTTPQIKTGFSMYLGNQKDGDASLAAGTKRFTLEAGGMGQWNLNREEVLRNRERALRMFSWLKHAHQVRITTDRGTNLTCDVSAPDGMYPVVGIIPFYSEVAIVPAIGSVDGVAIIDGASERAYHQRGFPIRPNIPGHREIYMEPIKLYFEKSELVKYEGPAIQKERMDVLMEKVTPQPKWCDEIGLVATTSVENDEYGWTVDGSHHIRCVHVALGNNTNRKEIIHAKEHIDFDTHDPSIWIDGVQICDHGNFLDDVIDKMSEQYK